MWKSFFDYLLRSTCEQKSQFEEDNRFGLSLYSQLGLNSARTTLKVDSYSVKTLSLDTGFVPINHKYLTSECQLFSRNKNKA